MNLKKWHYVRINGITMRARVMSDCIETREMNVWEKIIHTLFYWRK